MPSDPPLGTAGPSVCPPLLPLLSTPRLVDLAANASHAATCTACHGVGSRAEPVGLLLERMQADCQSPRRLVLPTINRTRRTTQTMLTRTIVMTMIAPVPASVCKIILTRW